MSEPSSRRRSEQRQQQPESLDAKLEVFFNMHQEANYNNGNLQFSGVPVGTAAEDPRLNTSEQVEEAQRNYDRSVEEQRERQNIRVICQNAVQPIFLRQALPLLQEVGHGGQNIANALSGSPMQPADSFGRQPSPLDPVGRRQEGYLTNMFRQISNIRDQTQQL